MLFMQNSTYLSFNWFTYLLTYPLCRSLLYDLTPVSSSASRNFRQNCNQRLRSASSQRLIVRRTRLRTAGDRAFGAAAPLLWNSLPADVATSQSLTTFKERLKHFCSNSRWRP